MVQAITVAPIANGWTLKSAAFDNDMFFQSDAEAAACSLGTKMARVVPAVQIQIFLRDGALSGRYICTPGRLLVLQPRDPRRTAHFAS